MSRMSKFGAALVAHPGFDMLAPVIVVGGWLFLLHAPTPDDNVSQNVFVAISTLSGLVMAAATFICTMTYQSVSRYMQVTHKRYHDELSRNWLSVIAWTAASAVAPIVSLCLWKTCERTATAISLWALILMGVKLIRSIHWLKYTLFMEKASMMIQEPLSNEDMKHAFQRRKSGNL
ncbi:Na+:H+ dicarboxylate symporter [Bifidobacterium moraviense]|uniref:Na+:H+ dicarboxylate symporter n=1 Tax=Bifidobacterium moraviense TaxID=2675323 RepID=UPI00145F199D|nr:Na+:H+ dicarboxylate symporter [Bifidobacterium sp. DSM 109958]